MKEIIIGPGNWRPDDTGVLFHPGTYRVPLDMSEELAQQAIESGAAEEVCKAEAKPTGRKPKAT